MVGETMTSKYKSIFKFFKDNIGENQTVVLACSGGPDSMCLLDLLIKYRAKANINIVLAHVHHNVRKESDEELVFVSEYANKNNVIFESMKIEKYDEKNFESEARNKRYKFFSKLLKKYNSNILLTAHHGDDLMETILMRLVRGSNLKGYAGFEKITNMHDYIILRPLIELTKADIVLYNKENNVPYVLDYTNDLDIHTRNRYRKYVLPRLKDEDPNVNLKFLKFSNVLSEYNDYIDKVVDSTAKKIINNNVLDIDKFALCEPLIQKSIINRMLMNIYKDNIVYINDKNVHNIINLINNFSSNSKLNLPKGKVAVKSYNNFYICDDENADDYEYVFKSKLILPNGMSIAKVNEEKSNSNFVCRLNSKDIKMPIVVRNRRNGDFVEVMNLKGHKKLKDIFIDSKISMKERKTWPVVLDSDGNIIWIPGLKKTKYNKQNNEKYDIILKYY